MNSRFSSIPVTETGKIQKLVVEYLKRNPSLKSLYKFEPEIDSIEKAILLKRSFPSTSREILSASLKSQYDEAGMLTSELEEHIDSLKSSDTFTITTGQQNGILLGPLYTVLKICSAISLADELTKRYPEKKFIPVFWMATEDHDIEEIRSVSVMAEKYKWETKQTGAAGRLSNEG
ncbi:MAG: bacillithiol biosynthesis BshC, partial [Bacteroidia bacterium]